MDKSSSAQPLIKDETARKITNTIILFCLISAVPAMIPSLHYAAQIVRTAGISSTYQSKVRTKLILGCFWIISFLLLGVWLVYMNRTANVRLQTFERLGKPSTTDANTFSQLSASQQFQNNIKLLFESYDRITLVLIFFNLGFLVSYFYAFSQVHKQSTESEPSEVQDLLNKERTQSWIPIGLLIAAVVVTCLKYGLSF